MVSQKQWEVAMPREQKWVWSATALIGMFLILLSGVVGCANSRRSCEDVPEQASAESELPQVPDQFGPESLKLTMLDGSVVRPYVTNQSQGVVLVFVSVDCPIANAYLPELHRISKEFGAEKWPIYLVHSAACVSQESIDRHVTEFKVQLPVVVDANQAIAKSVKATVTPEVCVLRRGSAEPVYRGAIDNLYAGYGKKRRKATEHYLQDALAALLSDQPIEVATTQPIGCFLSFEF